MPKPERRYPERTDQELIDAVRAEDPVAIDELVRASHPAALRVARCIVDPETAEDVAAESVQKLLQSIQRGIGPEKAIRPYLATIVRNTAADYLRRRREFPADLDEDLTAPVPDSSDRVTEALIVRSAFESLPARWQSVLWLTCVEDADRHEVGQRLGIRPGAVSQLALRAREGLRQAYLAQYVQAAKPTCQRVAEHLPAYVRERTKPEETARIEEHLDDCEACSRAGVDLRGLNLSIGATLAVAIVGTTAAISLVKAPTVALAATPLAKPQHLLRNVGVGAVVVTALASAVAVAASVNSNTQQNSAAQAAAQGPNPGIPAPTGGTVPTAGAVPTGTLPPVATPTGAATVVPGTTTYPAESEPSTAPSATKTTPRSTAPTPDPTPSKAAPAPAAPTPADTFTVAAPVLTASGNGAYPARLTVPITVTHPGTTLTAALWFSGVTGYQLIGGGWTCTSSSGGSFGGTVMECKTTTTQATADLTMQLDAPLPEDVQATVRSNASTTEAHTVSGTLKL